jgi:thioredoxin reductase (NADPH)
MTKYDCIVVGGGPAGLPAAIYLARFHLRVIVLDHAQGRAASIPVTYNHAGYPDGIAGRDLVKLMRLQAERYGAVVCAGEVNGLEKSEAGFTAITTGGNSMTARAVLLATGVVNHRPPMPELLHAEALARGMIRYCPVCDGFEITDQEIGVIGIGERAFNEALFLGSFTSRITLISPESGTDFNQEQLAVLSHYGITVYSGPVRDPAKQRADHCQAVINHDLVCFGLCGNGVKR